MIKYALNHKACGTQGGLNTTQCLALERFIVEAGVDFGRDCVTMIIRQDGSSTFNINSFAANSTDKQLMVCYALADEIDRCLFFGIPWAVILRNSADKGHITYVAASGVEEVTAKILRQSTALPTIFQKTNRRALYIGKTSQGLYKRARQHISSALTGGSTCPFHTIIRGTETLAPMAPVFQVLETYATEGEAYAGEEDAIADASSHSGLYCLNVISSRDAFARLIELFPDMVRKVPAERAEEELYRRNVMPRLHQYARTPEQLATVMETNRLLARDPAWRANVAQAHSDARRRIATAGLQWGDLTRLCEELFIAAPHVTLAEYRELCSCVPAQPNTVAKLHSRFRKAYCEV